MPKRSPDPRLVKIHRSYTYDDAARDLGVHKNTVRHWVTHEGLPALTEQRPHLVLGVELKAFLATRRGRKRTPCPPGHVYCFRCRAPRPPAEGLVDYAAIGQGHGTLSAFCPVCDTVMCRAVRKADLPLFEQAWKARPVSDRGEDRHPRSPRRREGSLAARRADPAPVRGTTNIPGRGAGELAPSPRSGPIHHPATRVVAEEDGPDRPLDPSPTTAGSPVPAAPEEKRQPSLCPSASPFLNSDNDEEASTHA